MHSRIRPFWPRSGAIGVSTTIGAPQATQGLVRRASFIFFLLPLISDVLIDRCGLRRPAAPLLQPGRVRLLAAGVLGRQRDASVTVFAHCFTDRERAVMRYHEFKRDLRLVLYPFASLLLHASVLVR